MKAILERIKNNPAVVLSLLVALFGVAASFGFELTKEQTGSITALVTVLVGFLIRSQVTPTRSVGALTDDLENPSGSDMMAGPASSVPTGDPVDVVARDEQGAVDGISLLVALACIVVIIAGVIFILRALT